ncbi:MAG: hypothetical protein M1819_003198 [Sarea resinae]|nr:MAG: hypothetical protein M1819_003198 [Sarea resinae]
MDLRQVGAALLRSSVSPWSAIIAPSACSRPWRPCLLATSMMAGTSSCSSTITARRTFMTSRPLKQEQEQGSSSTAPDPSGNASSSSSAKSMDETLDSLLSDIKRPASNTGRTSRFSSRYAQAGNRPGNSAANLNSDLDRSYLSQRSRFDTSRMLDPNASSQVSRNIFASEPPKPPAAPPMRLGPSLGRTVQVNPGKGMDLGRSLRVLDINCNKNSVRTDASAQRFHERPGLRRKRLKSQRWRKKFKLGFQAMVSKVEEMRRKGW